MFNSLAIKSRESNLFLMKYKLPKCWKYVTNYLYNWKANKKNFFFWLHLQHIGVPRQGSNQGHSRNPSCCVNITEPLTCCTTREPQQRYFLTCVVASEVSALHLAAWLLVLHVYISFYNKKAFWGKTHSRPFLSCLCNAYLQAGILQSLAGTFLPLSTIL